MALGRATLSGYRVAFVQWHDGWGGGVAGIVPDGMGVVEGVVYALSAENLRALDGCEPTGDGSYWREQVTVVTASADPLTVWVYRGHVAEDGPFAPSVRYLETIVTGAREHGLPAVTIAALLQSADA
jgi:gamma-glutamylcyclotransferase (GGCT)/AIG2-like uncharacterized protein YtfP